MSKNVVWLLLAATLFLSLGAAQGEKSYSAPRFDVSARIQEGGSLDVEETVTFQFEGGPFSSVFRELPLDFVDGLHVLSAGVDGQIWPQGTEPGQVEISGSDPVRVTWHLLPTTDAIHDFELSYRMLGVVRQGENADVLRWLPLPTEHEYTIGESHILVNYFSEAQLLSQPVVEPSSVIYTSEPGLASFRSADLGPGEFISLEFEFVPGSFISAPPRWQLDQINQAEQVANRNKLAWVWLSSSAILAIGGLAVLVRVWSSYRRPEFKRASVLYEAPSEFAPAIVGALRQNDANPNWNHALGTLFDLAEREFLTIEEIPAKKWYHSEDFLLQRSHPEKATFLQAHERMLLDLLFTNKSGHHLETIKLSKLGRLITSERWKRYSDALKAEMKAMELINRSRQDARRNIMIPGGVLIFLSFIAILSEIFLFDRFGLWPLALAFVLLLLGFACFIFASGIPVWSDAGNKIAAEWEPYYRYLLQVSRGKSGASHEQEFSRHLPYAAAYGLLHGWARRFEKDGYEHVPAYFRTINTSGSSQMASFVAMTAATSSSGGSAAGATAGAAGGAAGAAGGGASGAS